MLLFVAVFNYMPLDMSFYLMTSSLFPHSESIIMGTGCYVAWV